LLTRPTDGTTALPTHDDELPYVFGTLARGGLRFTRDAGGQPSAEALALSAKMMSAWVRFASTGDPNGGSLPRWPQLCEAGRLLCFDKQISLGEMPRVDDLLFIKGLGLESDADIEPDGQEPGADPRTING